MRYANVVSLIRLYNDLRLVIPAKAGIQDFRYLNEIKNWISAFAGMTGQKALARGSQENLSRIWKLFSESLFVHALDVVLTGPASPGTRDEVPRFPAQTRAFHFLVELVNLQYLFLRAFD